MSRATKKRPAARVIRWDTCEEDARLIGKVVVRAMSLTDLDRVTLAMDLTVTHLNGTPLDLPKLLAFPEFDFLHDVCGITRHIDRKTGELGDFFLPRCARRMA